MEAEAIARDAAALIEVPSVTGRERPALERLAELAAGLGLEPQLHPYDLAALRAHPEHPGEEAPRDELLGLTVTVPGERPRLCVNGHVDVVSAPAGLFRPRLEDGALHGRGAVDMKGPLVAALHGLAAVRGRARSEVVLQAVASEEDGGLGTFATLERDDRFDACLIVEPTGFEVVCAQAGALTFSGVVRGRAAHAALRLEGDSAIDRYVEVHAALREHERRLNSDVRHPLMAELALPYPLEVGRIAAGDWSSTVPDRLEFEGRLGVRLGQTLEAAGAALQADLAGRAELRFEGARFKPAETPGDHPFVRLLQEAAAAELGRPARRAGVPYGADMRLFCARGIPCVMCGPPGVELAHGPGERVRVEDLASTARIVERTLLGAASLPFS